MFQLMADLDQSISHFAEAADFASIMDQQKAIINELELLFDAIVEDDHNLSLRSYRLEINNLPGGTANGSGLYSYGSKVTVTASPEQGYFFNGWIGEGALDANATSTFVTMTKDRNLTAQFAPYAYKISILSALGGQVTGAGTYSYGELAELQAIADANNEFIKSVLTVLV